MFGSEGGATLVGIDAINVDDIGQDARPAHSILLDMETPIIERLTGMKDLPDREFEVTVLPPRVERLGTFPVRVVARVTAYNEAHERGGGSER